MTIEEYRTKIMLCRRDMLCEDEFEGLTPAASAHIELALSALADARAHLDLAGIFQAQAIAELGK
jgi:hypothetical protein